LLQIAGVDLVWVPSPEEIYPPGYQTYVTVEEMTRPLEGVSRPGHFRGVTTIVTKLFNVFQPTSAYFGQKDAQQAAVIGRMVRDLALNVDVVVCPTVREVDGLAMSSRNTRLDAGERKAATVLYGALFGAAEAWKHGEHDAGKLRELMTHFIEAEPLARIDYVSVANPDTLAEIDGQVRHALLSLAVYIGEVRLIDNIVLRDE
jgi:pantoate--beta-alanine ligase